ncbi:mannose-6-phosphate isomerase, class I [Levilactobacillus zymae]|uniref:mannose-6-phosphate isomerase, class I n=1 Tax=Levilactobacillus zymae TaxID=267363 RepID=UPI0028B88A44|nr:mannose-6-phosphate isomerase, class I [Levilactobacillus zymae]MDT6979248.1 mannose-6-phosphate isomerase, class I [Levilactobacillus zymae]
MQEPLFLRPVFHQKLWGGRQLERDFDYDLPAGDIGECWVISGHPHGPNQIANGVYKGQLLSDIYITQPELFGHPQMKRFPLLTKILDAEAPLSVQVHPGDEYAAANAHDLGKTECWYVIHAEPGAYLIYGHHAQTKAQLTEMVQKGDWEHLLRKQPVKSGDFVYVPSGTIHALTAGIEVLETQQSSDTTYRLYDWDRVDQVTGKKRALHIQQSLDVITVPFQQPNLHQDSVQCGKSTITELVGPPQSRYFSVFKNDINDTVKYDDRRGPYMLFSVIRGQGTLTVAGKHYSLVKGQHFIIPHDVSTWEISGQMLLISSTPSAKNY